MRSCISVLMLIGWLFSQSVSAAELNWKCRLKTGQKAFSGKSDIYLNLSGRELRLMTMVNAQVDDTWLYKILQADTDGTMRAYRQMSNRRLNARFGGDLFLGSPDERGDVHLFVTYSDAVKQVVGSATGRCARVQNKTSGNSMGGI